MKLADKVAIITGGNSGIGKATAELFAREGARVCITGRNEKRCREVVAEINKTGGQAVFVIADVRSPDECRKTVEATLEAFGRVDILFNNAGVYFPDNAVDCSEEEWDLTIDINLKGTHITAMGSDTPEKNELDPRILQKADIVVADSISECLLRGEIHQAIRAGVLERERIVELGNVIAKPELRRISEEQITIADLTGVAVQDIQIAKAVFHALKLKEV